mgnify:CR=1 FL=1
MVIPIASLPLPRPLRERVLQQFLPADARSEPGALGTEELVRYLGSSRETDSSPLSTIRRRAARDGCSDDLQPEHLAVLSWVCEAFDDWQEIYPLESPLREQIHRLLPLAVAQALVDDEFFLVGAHPLHQLLDAIQNGAVGWQARLERAGQMLEQRIQRSVEKALEWFEDRDLDIGQITRELQAANDRDSARAERMVQRLAEAEHAQVRTLEARRQVAEEFNAALERYPLPAAIGEFVRGPWYDSAQLVMVKYGADSAEWGDMRRTTRQLMESVQPRGELRDVERERRDQLLRRLPAELRRWLLSLQHDSDATDSAIGLVEYSHLRMQHGQQLQLDTVPAIPIDDNGPQEPDHRRDAAVVGEWYRFRDEQGELRAQLVLELGHGQHLVFANFVGLKALSLGVGEFQQGIADGSILPLPAQCTFSAALASAAGIDSDEALDRFLDPRSRAGAPASGDGAAAIADDAAAPGDAAAVPDDAAPAPADDATAAGAEARQEKLPRAAPAAPAAASDDEAQAAAPAATGEAQPTAADSTAADPPPGAQDPRESDPDAGSDRSETAGAAEPAAGHGVQPQYAPWAPEPTAPSGEAETPPRPAPEPPAAATPPPPARATAPRPAPAPVPEAPPTVAPAPTGPAFEPVPEFAGPRDEAPAAPQPRGAPAHEDRVPPREYRARFDYRAPPHEYPAPPRAADMSARTDDAAAPRTAPPSSAEPQTQHHQPAAAGEAAPAAALPRRDIDVPMGAWLGFHDGETPMMAKLAVYDPRRDIFIFVNRRGIAMREIGSGELGALIDEGLVDILETRSYFRDEVRRARGEDA